MTLPRMANFLNSFHSSRKGTHSSTSPAGRGERTDCGARARSRQPRFRIGLGNGVADSCREAGSGKGAGRRPLSGPYRSVSDPYSVYGPYSMMPRSGRYVSVLSTFVSGGRPGR